jgi:hypothetical protein
MQHHPTLTNVDLRGNFVTLDAGRLLADVVLDNSKLEVVSGIPVRDIRGQEVVELEYTNDRFFMYGSMVHRTSDPFFATGDAELMMELLLHYPQPHLTTLCLANQALASDTQGVAHLFEKLGAVVAASPRLELLHLGGFWDCGTAAGKALGRHIRNHSCLKTIHIGTGLLDMKLISETTSGTSEAAELLDLRKSGLRDCGAGILSECLPECVRKLDVRGSGIGACGHMALSQCLQLKDINSIPLEEFTSDCTSIDLSINPPLSSGAVACVIARTRLTPNLSHLNLSGSNLTSKSHCHVLTPVIGGRGMTSCDGGCDCSSFDGTNAYMNCAQCDLDFCSTCCMSECPMISLAESLERLPNLVSLKIANCSFQGGRYGPVRSQHDEFSYKVLGAALSKHERISDLDISRNYFTGPGFPHLACGVALMPSLKTLTVGTHAVDFTTWLEQSTIEPDTDWIEAEVLILARAIARNHHLRHLNLSNVRRYLSAEVVRALVDSLRVSLDRPAADNDTEAKACSMSTSSTDPSEGDDVAQRRSLVDTILVEGIELPFARLREGSVHRLDLSANEFTNQESLAALFALMIDAATALTEVDFSNQDFGSATTVVISSLQALEGRVHLKRYNKVELQPSPEMTILCLQGHPVMPHGISMLASTTIPNGNIVELNLSGCCMDADSLGMLLSAVMKRKMLTSLDVSDQPLGRAGVKELADFLRVDKKLQVLCARRISSPPTGDGEMLEFTRALETNVTLATLDLRGNMLAGNIRERLKRTMEEKRSVVPLPQDLKYTFLLCNRRLPRHQQLPEVSGAEISALISAGSALVLIFRFSGRPRELLLSGGGSQPSSNDDRSDDEDETF